MIAITGATGHLGQLVIADLLTRGVKPQSLVAIVRDPAKAHELATKGVNVRVAAYDAREALITALAGVRRILLISGTDLGQRAAQHGNVIEAAKAARVEQFVYTSLLNCDRSQISLAEEHLATEKLIAAARLPHVILRNGWYIENYGEQLATYLKTGVVAGCAGNGRVSAATRADYAAAAAAVLLAPHASNAIHELAGPAFTLAELALEISKVSGRDVQYRNLAPDAYEQMLLSFNLPPALARMLVSADQGIARGELYTERRDLEKLLGRLPMSFVRILASTLKAA